MKSGSKVSNPRANEAKATILIVEDDKELSEILAQAFAAQGFRAIEAMNAFDALGLILGEFKGTISAVLTDVHMKNGSGLDLAKALHLMKTTVPIYFMTGDPMYKMNPEDAVGVSGLFYKPFNNHDIVDIVGKKAMPEERAA